jgi:hypothetical protein
VLDLTGLQNLFFTFILIGVYSVSLGSSLVEQISKGLINESSPLDESFVALLAISHAGYLVPKAIDKQPEAPTSILISN